MEDLRLSVSKTKCWKQCKKQFEFNYILKFPKKERDYHIFGKFCHEVLELFHKAYIFEDSKNPYNIQIGIAFKTALEKYKPSMTKEMILGCKEIISQYLKIISEEKKNNKIANIIGIEKNFALEIENNIILNGMIDRIQVDDDNVIHVADYKTTKNPKYLKNDWFQLLVYAYIILSENPTLEKVRGSYILLKHDFKYITKEFSRDEILKIKDEFIKIAQSIREEDSYEASPTVLCGWCDFLDKCDEGKKQTNTFCGEVDW
jgi:RecB family exonuclease